jgi:alpha-ketoglutarate-dependent taurine dioxygenase
VLFRGMTLERMERFMSGIGPIHETEYGRSTELRIEANTADLAKTGQALPPHTDYTYKNVGPLLQFQLFAANNAVGGESLLVDGFRVAEDLRREAPEHFLALTTTKVEFRQHYPKWRYHHCYKRPILECDDFGRVSSICFGHSHAYDWQIDFERAEQFYAAYAELFRRLKSSSYTYVIRLQAGEGMAIQNERVLHGRTRIESCQGERHLYVSFVPWAYVMARVAFHSLQGT